MKKFFLPASFVFAVVFSVIFFVTPVHAQSDSQVFIKDQTTDKIVELRTLYRDQVKVYRDSEKAFRIAKTNYENVQTLISLEESVEATSQVMLDRSSVLITYLELLDTTLGNTAGVELSTKSESLKELESLINAIKIHQESIKVTSDRAGVNILADEFQAIDLAYDVAVYKALALIRIGKIQTIRDQAEIINADIISKQKDEEAGALLESKRERAYNEIDRSFKSINNGLADLSSSFIDSDSDSYNRSFYENILKDLLPVYAKISQSLDHLEELLTI